VVLLIAHLILKSRCSPGDNKPTVVVGENKPTMALESSGMLAQDASFFDFDDDLPDPDDLDSSYFQGGLESYGVPLALPQPPSAHVISSEVSYFDYLPNPDDLDVTNFSHGLERYGLPGPMSPPSGSLGRP